MRKIIAYSSLNKLLQRSITLFKKNQFFLNPTKNSNNKNDFNQINNEYSIENSAKVLKRLSLMYNKKEVGDSPISKIKLDVLSKDTIEQINIFHDDLDLKKKFNKYQLLLSDLKPKDNNNEKLKLNEKISYDYPIIKKYKNKTDQKLIQIDEKENFLSKNNNNFLNVGINNNSNKNLKIKQTDENNLKSPNFQIPAQNNIQKNFKGNFKEIDENKNKNQTSFNRDNNIRFKSDEILNINGFNKGFNQKCDFTSNTSLKDKINIFDPIKSKELKDKILGENKILKNTIDNGKKLNSFRNSYLNKDKIAAKNPTNLNTKMPVIKKQLNNIENFNEIAKYKNKSLTNMNGNDLICI